MTKKDKFEIKPGSTVRLRVHSGEIVEGRVVHMSLLVSADFLIASG
jgi:hypothetical protein